MIKEIEREKVVKSFNFIITIITIIIIIIIICITIIYIIIYYYYYYCYYLFIYLFFQFNGGGHINHSIFWQNLATPSVGGGERPTSGALKAAIEAEFGTFDKFIATFNAQTTAVQGSGWGWLGYNKTTNRVQIATSPNQDPLQATTGLVPLLGIDVWEHAYYLQYRNVRPDYLNAIWSVVNWKDVERRLAEAQK